MTEKQPDGNLLGGLEARKINRRDFLKTSALLGGSALLASQLGWAASAMQRDAASSAGTSEYDYEVQRPENTIYSTCLQCHVACPLKGKLMKGVLYKLDGNPYSPQQRIPHLSYSTSPFEAAGTDGKLCSKGQAGIQTLYDPYRLVKVVKRAGPRGANKWRTISFEQAISEIVDGGDLFGEGHVDGLKDVLALRDPALAKAMADDVAKIKKGAMSVAEFKAKHANHLDVLIDPDHPDKGPKNNQYVSLVGRAEHGRKEYLKRFTFDTFGSPNYIDHFNICEESHHIAHEMTSNQYGKGKWSGGKEHFKPDLLNAEFVIFWGTGAFEANFGSTPMAEKLTWSQRERGVKYAVVDPRLSQTAGKAYWWLPVKPGADAALALAMMRWIFENERFDAGYLENANKAAAAEDGEPTWSSGAYLVKIEEGRPARFLRASDVGIGDEHQFVVSKGGELIAVTPEDADAPVHGDLFAEIASSGVEARTSLRLLREIASAKSMAEWAEVTGIRERDIIEVAREFTGQGKRAAVDSYRGVCQHANGYYNAQAIQCLNLLIGNIDWAGGMSAGGGHWHEFGGKPGNPYNFGKLHPGKLTKFGMPQNRQGWRYEDTTLFREDGYPARRPFYPFSSGVYNEVLPSIADGYPYAAKVVFLHKGTPALSIPGATQSTIDTLRDPGKAPLLIASDVVIGETSMYADYIFPDLTYLERWGLPHATPDVQTATSKVRQPVVGPLTEIVNVDGEDLPVCMETFMIAVAKRLGLSGVGKDGFGPGMNFDRPEDFYLKAVANIAMGDKEGDSVPDADDWEMDLFRNARRHLPSAVFDEERWRRAVGPDRWRKVVYVLNRGGRYEDFSGAYAGDLLRHRFGRMASFFAEEVAEARNSITGEHFSGLPVYEPPAGADGQTVRDSEYEFQLITYKEIFGGHSRTISNYWANISIQPYNRAWINRQDAERLGLKDGDAVRLTSASNPTGSLDLGNGRKKEMVAHLGVREGIRPGVVAVSWHYGHWAYGSADVEIDGQVVRGDARRGGGLCANPLLRTDTKNGNVGLTDPIGGSASFYDTRVNIEKASSSLL